MHGASIFRYVPYVIQAWYLQTRYQSEMGGLLQDSTILVFPSTITSKQKQFHSFIHITLSPIVFLTFRIYFHEKVQR